MAGAVEAAKKAAKAKIKQLSENSLIPQADAKLFMPPGGFIWQSKGSRSWRGRIPPLKAAHRSWRKHGHEGAVFLVVQECWKQWCTLQGIPPDECPVKGVFSDAAASSSSRAPKKA